MRPYYKVWVQIEKIYCSDRDPENVSEPVDVAVCTTLRQAEKILESMADRYSDKETVDDWKDRGLSPFKKKRP